MYIYICGGAYFVDLEELTHRGNGADAITLSTPTSVRCPSFIRLRCAVRPNVRRPSSVRCRIAVRRPSAVRPPSNVRPPSIRHPSAIRHPKADHMLSIHSTPSDPAVCPPSVRCPRPSAVRPPFAVHPRSVRCPPSVRDPPDRPTDIYREIYTYIQLPGLCRPPTCFTLKPRPHFRGITLHKNDRQTQNRRHHICIYIHVYIY